MRVGRHILVDGTGADPGLLNDPERLSAILERACQRAGASVLQKAAQRFEPQGVTVLILLAESHASIHTYPEHGYYAVDVFTCGSVDPTAAAEEICQQLGGENFGWSIPRGDEYTVPVRFPRNDGWHLAGTSARRCEAIKADGDRCAGIAQKDRDYCWNHDPSRGFPRRGY